MKKKWTPEDEQAWRAGREERRLRLHERIRKIEAELGAKRKKRPA